MNSLQVLESDANVRDALNSVVDYYNQQGPSESGEGTGTGGTGTGTGTGTGGRYWDGDKVAEVVIFCMCQDQVARQGVVCCIGENCPCPDSKCVSLCSGTTPAPAPAPVSSPSSPATDLCAFP